MSGRLLLYNFIERKKGFDEGYEQGRADAEREFQNSDYWNDYLAKVIADAKAEVIEEVIRLARAEIDFESQAEQKRFVEFMEQLKEQK